MDTHVIYLGIEAEQIRRRSNLLALKHLIDGAGTSHILRNEESYDNLQKIPMTRSRLFLGCEPSLMLNDDDLKGFEYRSDTPAGERPLVGFAVRDHFSQPFKMSFPSLKLTRQGVSLGQLTEEMKTIVAFTARIADYMVEKYNARIVFIPHHYLPPSKRVIMTDCEVAEQIIRQMKNAGEAAVLENSLHPFQLIDFYRRLHLVFSMRHHANSFAYLHQVPVMGYNIAEKIRSFFKHVSIEDMLIDPFASDMDPVFAQIDHAMQNREAIVKHLGSGLQRLRQNMNEALDIVLADRSHGQGKCTADPEIKPPPPTTVK
jgi:polysaccharide pyruvyl transferase WcaK-like protein